MNEQNGSLEASIQKKLDSDTKFQEQLSGITDETEKSTLVETKRKELLEAEFKDLSGRVAKSDEVAGNYKTRAEKAETELKGKGGEIRDKDLSSTDIYTLVEAKVPKEDIEEVKEYAAFKKISIADALKSSTVKTLLKDNAEKRKTADATATGTARGSSKRDGKSIMEDIAQKGADAIPDPGSEEAEEYFWAKRGGRPARK